MLDDEDLAAWVAGLNDLFALVAGRFSRVEPRLQARAYVRGLLAPLASKNGWTLAEAAGNRTPDKMQRLLNRASWDAGGVRDDVRGYVVRHLGDAGGVLVVVARKPLRVGRPGTVGDGGGRRACVVLAHQFRPAAGCRGGQVMWGREGGGRAA